MRQIIPVQPRLVFNYIRISKVCYEFHQEIGFTKCMSKFIIQIMRVMNNNNLLTLDIIKFGICSTRFKHVCLGSPN